MGSTINLLKPGPIPTSALHITQPERVAGEIPSYGAVQEAHLNMKLAMGLAAGMNRAQDWWLVNKARWGLSSSVAPQFDVRVVGRSEVKPAFTPHLLERKVRECVQNGLAQLAALGFRNQCLMHVIAEVHPRSIALHRGINKDFLADVPEWIIPEFIGPCMVQTWAFLGIPAAQGWRLFLGDFDQAQIRFGHKQHRILCLPAYNSEHHTVDKFSSVMHELAHATEPRKGHVSQVWLEARADVLTWATTGISAVETPVPVKVNVSDEMGNLSDEKRLFHRDFRNPRVRHIQQIFPNVEVMHDNSVLLSHFMFELSEKMGQQTLIDFIHWMDGQREMQLPAIVKRVAGMAVDKFKNLSRSILYVDTNNVDEVRCVIMSVMQHFGQLVAQWAHDYFSDGSQQEEVLDLLRQKGLI